MKTKILFLLKRKNNYNGITDSYIGMSTGLFNSSSFVNDMLNDNGVESYISVVIDNNCIDREVTKYKPTHVIIEALWVIPSKFEVLKKLHPNVKWIIRLHSEIPFLANEGIAMKWIGDYVSYDNVFVSLNSRKTLDDIKDFIKEKTNWSYSQVNKKIIYLPNYYPQNYKTKKINFNNDVINIGCFGAIRPMKNHLIQALSAIKFADSIGKKLRFHVNSGRVEQKGESVLRNLEGLFEHLDDHELINHEWLPREEFLELCSKMDIGMQISLSETFNIVAADLISQGTPVVGSNEIPWLFPLYTSTPTHSDSIVNKLIFTYYTPKINVLINKFLLTNNTNVARKTWLNYFK